MDSNGIDVHSDCLKDLEKGSRVEEPGESTSSFMLEVVDVDFIIKVKSPKSANKSCYRKSHEEKQILNGVSATFYSGQMSALLGSSGAGKTTLMNYISGAGDRQSNQIGTDATRILFNGKPITKKFSKMCSYIPQDDILFPGLTARQSIFYSAKLRLEASLSNEEINERVDKLMADLELSHCQHNLVGDVQMRGLSGGERKRVSLGIELIVEPPILLIDECTSGLDSTLATEVIRVLRKIVKKNNTMVITTIHQPSAELFSQFDRVLLLQLGGRVVYEGRRIEAEAYFRSVGYHLPQYQNPIEFYLLQIYNDQESQVLAKKWAERSKPIPNNVQTTLSNSFQHELSKRNSWWHQFKILLQRQAIDTTKDKRKFLRYIISKLTMGLVMGLVFLNQGRTNAHQTDVLKPLTSSLFFFVAIIEFNTHAKTLVEYPQLRPFIVREYRNGVSLFPYFCASALNNMFFENIASLFYLPCYFLVGLALSAEQFFVFLYVVVLTTCFATLTGLMFGASSDSVKGAQTKIVPIMFLFLLFSGYAIPLPSIPNYFIWLYYVSFLQYGYTILSINQFADYQFDTGQAYSSGEDFLLSEGISPDNLGSWMIILLIYVLAILVLCFLVVHRSINRYKNKL